MDIGSNTVRLLVSDLDTDTGAQHDVLRTIRVARLAEGVDRDGRLAPAARTRALAALTDLHEQIVTAGVDDVRAVATSAVRDAADGPAFVEEVGRLLGTRPVVLSGAQEARLSFSGAVGGLLRSGAALGGGIGDPSEVLVVDVGGGSTELAVGAVDRPDDVRVHSMDVGAVRLRERRLEADPPTLAQVSSARADVAQALRRARSTLVPPAAPLVAPRPIVVAVSGTAVTLAALDRGVRLDRAGLVHGVRLSRQRVRELTEAVLSRRHDDLAADPAVLSGRADVLGAGALVLDAVLQHSGADGLVVSESDLLDGVGWSALRD